MKYLWEGIKSVALGFVIAVCVLAFFTIFFAGPMILAVLYGWGWIFLYLIPLIAYASIDAYMEDKHGPTIFR